MHILTAGENLLRRFFGSEGEGNSQFMYPNGFTVDKKVSVILNTKSLALKNDLSQLLIAFRG